MIRGAAGKAGVPITVQLAGTMFTPFFTDQPVQDFVSAKRTNREAYNKFFHALLDAGVYLPPSPFESAFSSTVHGDVELDALEAALGVAWQQ
jgi:glutamate-1-semialdehyde 2,1-aminomutase